MRNTMEVHSLLPEPRHPFGGMEGEVPLAVLDALRDELAEGLSRYWEAARRLLAGSGVRLREPDPAYFSRDANIFSALFLHSYVRFDIPRHRRVLYAAVNQCLRGMVTGCDNLLDDEYKITLDTDLPEQGTRFRSVLDIMASDRVLFELLIEESRRGGLPLDQVLAATSASLHSLLASGAQEAAEEGGVNGRLAPVEVLRSVHHLKTGLLFRCPWAVPTVLEDLDPTALDPTLGALYDIGMGCQILDDLVDLARDVREGRHNYVASLVCHDTTPKAWEHLQERAATASGDLALEFPRARHTASAKALEFLLRGTQALFATEPRSVPDAITRLLIRRIGADSLVKEGEA